MNWTGNETVEHGTHAGKQWKNIHMNTLDWYVEKLNSGPLKSCAEAEKARRHNAYMEGKLSIREYMQ